MSRPRPFRSLPSLAVVLLLLVAVAPATGQAPKSGGVLVTSPLSATPSLSPHEESTIATVQQASPCFSNLLVFDPAKRQESADTLVPELAEKWTWQDSFRTLVFTLRRDVKWHDGKPFTSADVKFTYLEVLAKYHPTGRLGFSNLASIDTPDPHTAVMKLKAPFAPLLFMTNLNSGPVLPKHLLEGQDVTAAEFNRKPVGTGPFRITEAVKGSHYVLERFPDYFKKGRPYLDRVILRVMPAPASRVLAFEKGESTCSSPR